ncbi:MAG: hypothetical protein ACLP7Q_19975 [Isosphaeraceae bacterium]
MGGASLEYLAIVNPSRLPLHGISDFLTVPGPATSTGTARRQAASTRPDLTAVVAAWNALPEAIKAGILAMVKAARP